MIQVLGFGSLIWDLDDLAPKVRGPWRLGEGPVMPLEFSYVSAKRLGALALVIDHAHGAPCPTAAIPSTRARLADAANDLAARERCSLRDIGWADRDGWKARDAGLGAAVRDWVRAEGAQGAVWTDGLPNFAALTGLEWRVEAGRGYLATLEGRARDEAETYIREAPPQTLTPLRRSIQAEGWPVPAQASPR